ncbi:flagellar protein FlaG [Solimonas terrae]|uniref:Flagellar protein FlaG n=1 Tax=Solimonas terrae TaxID=1396819 RepID=A0A6M2BQ52_9GAMM|nr:flagellar protein FlaG [Solimonas terrae]NGY04420.1 flagellar protein FlaG [Solimonas terrae]
MADLINAVEATAASSGRGLDVVRQTVTDTTVPAASGAGDQKPVADDSELRAALQALAGPAQNRDVGLDYRVDPDLGRVIVELVDRKDGTVLRQIPSEEALRLARLMKDGRGILVQAQA